MMTIAGKFKLLDLLKVESKFAAVHCHFGVNESTVHYIKTDEANIRKTAVITFNKAVKRVVTASYKTIASLEAALIIWKADCRKKNINLDTNVI